MGMAMTYYGKTDSFECPECASKQMAAVLGMEPGGQRAGLLSCLTCDTVWDPRVSDLGKHQDHDLDHTPGEVTEGDGLDSGSTG